MASGIPLFLAFLLILLVPSSNLQRFDGLPLGTLPEFFALGLLIPFLFFPELRNRQAALWKRWKMTPALPAIILALLLVLKAMLFASGSHAGYTACYRSPAEPTSITHEQLPPRECERSYENLFNRFSATRLDGKIWFGPDTWNLVFLNTNRYNYYDWVSGSVPRERIPLKASWSGYPDAAPGETIRVEYVGEGSVDWGDSRILLPPSYGESNSVEFSPSRTDVLMRVEFAFDDGSRSGEDPQSWGPAAMINVSAGEPSRMRPLAAKITGGAWKAPALFADALILLLLFSLIPALWGSVRGDLFPLALLAAGMGLITLLPIAPVLRTIGVSIALAAFLVAHLVIRPFRSEAVYAAVVAAGFAILHVWTPGIGQVLLRSAGNDPLTYESQAYSILYTGSLRGGESVFWAIPGYRYIKFLEHALFGDGDALYAAVQLAAFFGGVFWLFRNLRDRSVPAIRKILLVGTGCGLIFLGGYYASRIIREGLSEYETWIFLLWALPGLYGMASPAAILAGMIALSVSYTIRPNQFLGILWILFLPAVVLWKKHKKMVLLYGILALGTALLPLAHNIYFGHQWVLTTTTGGTPANMTLPPSTWLAFFHGDPTATEAVREQIGMIFLISDAPRSVVPTLATMGGFFACWLAVAGFSIARRKAFDCLLLATPIFYLSAFSMFVVNNYYPRHIVIAYLSMAIVAVIVLLRDLQTIPAMAGPAVELPRK
jgi:hypothetical protein